MKTVNIFLAISTLLCSTANAQSVGIGTATPNASAILDVVSTSKGLLIPRMANKASIGSPVEGLIVYETGTKLFYQYDGGSWRKMLNSTFWNSSDTRSFIFNTTDSIGIGTSFPSERFHLSGNLRLSGDIKMIGDAGIGVTSPEQRLHVRSSTSSQGILLEAINPILQLRQSNTPEAGYSDKGFIQLSGDNIRIGTNSNNIPGKFVVRTGGGDRLMVDGSGNVSIGTTKVAAGYLLNVGGKGIFEEIKVQLEGSWPDYVFDEKYSLMSLDKLEEYISINKHLPNIPDATAIANNGVELGEMQRLLTEKVEELTLYIIALKKEIDQLKTNSKTKDK